MNKDWHKETEQKGGVLYSNACDYSYTTGSTGSTIQAQSAGRFISTLAL